jgi:hypothetical protein
MVSFGDGDGDANGDGDGNVYLSAFSTSARKNSAASFG